MNIIIIIKLKDMKNNQSYSDDGDGFLDNPMLAWNSWSANNYFSSCTPHDTLQDIPQYTPKYTHYDAAGDFMIHGEKFESSLHYDKFFSSLTLNDF